MEASIQENGLLDPIIISKDNTIISGHRRWNACKNIGLENVDVRVEDFQDETIALVELNRYRNSRNLKSLNLEDPPVKFYNFKNEFALYYLKFQGRLL